MGYFLLGKLPSRGACRFLQKTQKFHTLCLFLSAVAIILLLFQLVMFLIAKYGSSEDELHVAQAVLDSKLFQRPVIEKVVEHSSNLLNSSVSLKVFMPSKHLCGFPVSKISEGLQGKPGVIGTLVLLKGGVAPSWVTSKSTILPGNATKVPSLSFDVYASVFCAKKLLSQLPNPHLLRYITFLERAVAVPLSLPEKADINRVEFCSKHLASVNPRSSTSAAHALIRAFAVGSQLAEVYRLQPLAPDTLPLHVTTLPSLHSRLEGLAVLTAVLTSLAGTDEALFQAYLEALKLPKNDSAIPLNNETLNRPQTTYRWLTEADHPRFCNSSSQFSCDCPRLYLVHSIAERQRAILMASLRQEATRIQADLVRTAAASSSASSFLASLSPSNFSHSDWPHQALAAVTGALCNHSLPLAAFPNPTGPAPTISICSVGNASSRSDCISEDIVQRLWEVTAYADKAMWTSPAQQQFSKLSSYPFLRIIEKQVAGVKTRPNATPESPWLHVYSGQPDSIALMLRALNLTYSSTHRTAGRFVVEVYAGDPPNLRFLVDDNDITPELGFCGGSGGVCSADRFTAYLASQGFWRFASSRKPHNSSETVFHELCSSWDTRGLHFEAISSGRNDFA